MYSARISMYSSFMVFSSIQKYFGCIPPQCIISGCWLINRGISLTGLKLNMDPVRWKAFWSPPSFAKAPRPSTRRLRLRALAVRRLGRCCRPVRRARRSSPRSCRSKPSTTCLRHQVQRVWRVWWRGLAVAVPTAGPVGGDVSMASARAR